MKNVDAARITDVALMLGPLSREAASEARPAYFDEPLQLAPDIVLGRFPFDERVLQACQSPGENWERYHEFSTYAIWHTGATYFVEGKAGFNNARRLSTVMQLSRLVRPTSLGFTRAARIIEWDASLTEIVPSRAESRGARIFVADSSKDWLRDTDVPALRAIIATFKPASLPERVNDAMRHFEYTHGLDDFNSRWPMMATAVEALVHTDERKKVYSGKGMRVTDQFVYRLLNLGKLVPGTSWTEDELDQAYEDRSGFAHGRGLNGVSPDDLIRRYRSFEENVRRVLHALVLDAGLAAIFVDDDSIRKHLNP